MPLNPKQRRFIAEFLKDQNGTQAAIRAGYSKKTAKEQACRLLTNVHIHKAVDAGLDSVSKRCGVTAEYVLNGLKVVSERCLQKEPVMEFDHEEKRMVQVCDEETGAGIWQFDSAGANRALELMGKHLKLYTEKTEITGKDGAPLQGNTIDLSGIDVTMLIKLASGGNNLEHGSTPAQISTPES